jgi:hypothetical protein
MQQPRRIKYMNRILSTPYSATTLLVLLVLTAAFEVRGQTFTSIMAGETSTKIAVNGDSMNRTSVTSIQTPFAFPNGSGAYDSVTYPTGNSSGTPPWWFLYYKIGSTYYLTDLTPSDPYRSAQNSQQSSAKSGVMGIRAWAKFSGTATGSEIIETIYFGERQDWAGEREFGFARYAVSGPWFFYWSVNSNCSITANLGYPWCRLYRAVNGASENPGSAPLLGEFLYSASISSNLSVGTEYLFIGYLFWANWDSTYKFRVEVWDSTYTTQISAVNVDSSVGWVNYGATTSGMTGYVNLGTVQSGTATATGVQLSVAEVDIGR